MGRRGLAEITNRHRGESPRLPTLLFYFSTYFFQFVTNVGRRQMRRMSALMGVEVTNVEKGGLWRQQPDIRVSVLASPYPFYFLFLSILFQFVTNVGKRRMRRTSVHNF